MESSTCRKDFDMISNTYYDTRTRPISLPGLGGPNDVVLGEDCDLRVVVLANARVLVHAQVHVDLRHVRPQLNGQGGGKG